jgi:hypothetical protein
VGLFAGCSGCQKDVSIDDDKCHKPIEKNAAGVIRE